MSSSHVIRVREATPADLEAIIDIYSLAFDENIMNQLMYPKGFTASCRKAFGSRFLPEQPAEDGKTSTGGKKQTLVCVAEYLPKGDSTDGPGEIVAFAKWGLQREPLSEEEWKNETFEATHEGWGDDCDITVVNTFICEMNRIQRDHAKGEAALYLHIIGCAPARQRSGAGSALMQWGVNLADSLGLPSRLEASPAGYGLYRKFGYEDVAVMDVKVSEIWGRTKPPGSNWGENNAIDLAGPVPPGAQRTVIMRRPQKTAIV
ncbi:hypothetical protein C7999DRAFT_33974 [Corynascus novoguineensis]|uniref:N-acetyltransferase domain-containing protein n=1 Tax=Corynascus novoguineensis TaxID=1126955 RepID=A0AAN7CP63_9PEZI|nr:hypothetical protein C7999DRAFT_33974 [Corynascus novoguineensis]